MRVEFLSGERMANKKEFTIARKSVFVKHDEGWGHGFSVGGEIPAIIRTVKKGSPADQGGLLRGDFILKISGNPVSELRGMQVEKMLNNLKGRDLTLVIARPDPVPKTEQERKRAILTLQMELKKASQKKINTSMFERGQNPFPDALTSVNDLLNTLGPMPLGKAPREDPYTSSDDEGPPKGPSKKKRSPSPLTSSLGKVAAKGENGTFVFNEDPDFETPPPSDDEEEPADPLLNFDDQSTGFKVVRAKRPSDVNLQDFTVAIQNVAEEAQQKRLEEKLKQEKEAKEKFERREREAAEAKERARKTERDRAIKLQQERADRERREREEKEKLEKARKEELEREQARLVERARETRRRADLERERKRQAEKEKERAILAEQERAIQEEQARLAERARELEREKEKIRKAERELALLKARQLSPGGGIQSREGRQLNKLVTTEAEFVPSFKQIKTEEVQPTHSINSSPTTKQDSHITPVTKLEGASPERSNGSPESPERKEPDYAKPLKVKSITKDENGDESSVTTSLEATGNVDYARISEPPYSSIQETLSPFREEEVPGNSSVFNPYEDVAELSLPDLVDTEPVVRTETTISVKKKSTSSAPNALPSRNTQSESASTKLNDEGLEIQKEHQPQSNRKAFSGHTGGVSNYSEERRNELANRPLPKVTYEPWMETPYSEMTDLVISKPDTLQTVSKNQGQNAPPPVQSDLLTGIPENPYSKVAPVVTVHEKREEGKASTTSPTHPGEQWNKKSYSLERGVIQPPKKSFWKRLSHKKDQSFSSDGIQLMKHSSRNPDSIPSNASTAASHTKGISPTSSNHSLSSTGSGPNSVHEDIPDIPPYNPPIPDPFPLSNRKEYIDSQTQKGRPVSRQPIGYQATKSKEGMTSAQLKQHRRLSIQGQQELLCETAEVASSGLPFPVHQWNTLQVCTWLKQLNSCLYSNYHKLFEDHEITGRSLLRLSDSQLTQMGIDNGKHKAVLTSELSRLKMLQTSIELRDLSTDPRPSF